MKRSLALIALGLLLGACVPDPRHLPVPNGFDLLQDVNLAGSFVFGATELAWVRLMWKRSAGKYRWRSLYGFGAIALAIHYCVFYVFTIMVRVSFIHWNAEVEFMTGWSVVLRFHEIGLMGVIAWDRYRTLRMRGRA